MWESINLETEKQTIEFCDKMNKKFDTKIKFIQGGYKVMWRPYEERKPFRMQYNE